MDERRTSDEHRKRWTISEYQYHHFQATGEWLLLEELSDEYDEYVREARESDQDDSIHKQT